MIYKLLSMICFCLFLGAEETKAQNYDWAQNDSFSCGNYCSSTAIDAANNVYAAGATFLSKFNPNGDLIWTKNEPFSSMHVAIDRFGFVYAVGGFRGHITFGCYTLFDVDSLWGPSTTYLVKYDSSGNTIWAKCAQGAYLTNDNVANAITTDSVGDIYIAGQFRDTITFEGGLSLNANGGGCHLVQKEFVAKFDSAGNIVWAKTTSDGGYATATSIAASSTGEIYVSGYFPSYTITFGSTVLSNDVTGTADDMFLVKYGPLGDVIWAKNAGGRVNDFATSLTIDHSDNIYVTGFFSDTVNFGTTALVDPDSGSFNIFLLKFDTSGSVIWGHTMGGINQDIPNAVTTDNHGNIFITGSFTSPEITFGSSVITNDSTGSNDIFLAKYDSIGSPSWAVRSGGHNDDESLSVSADNSGHVYIGGYFVSLQTTFGATTLTTCDSTLTNDNAFLAKLESNSSENAAGLAHVNRNSAHVDIFPNPNNGTFLYNLQCENNDTIEVTITSALGQVVKKYTLSPNRSYELKLDTYSPGLYIITTSSEHGRLVNKIIID